MSTATGLLGVTLGSEQAEGSNLRDAATGAGWLYALPRLAFERIACIGAPSEATLAALVRAGPVAVVEVRLEARSATANLVERRGWSSVTVSDTLDEDPVDLLVLLGRDPAVRQHMTDVRSRLGPDGILYAEGSRGRALAGSDRTDGGMRLRLTPVRGEPRSIVPADDLAMQEAIHDLGLEGSLARRRRLAGLERRIMGLAPMRAATHRDALVDGPGLPPGSGVPAYLATAAHAHGLELAGWRWAVAARGDYDSQKILVLLARPDAATPTGVVKVTRSSSHAWRLENEAAALQSLAALPVADGRVPSPWFDGTHAGRAILGESLVDGRPFKEVATFSVDDPHLDDAMGWLTDLAATTARPVPAAEVAEVLGTLLARFERIYRPDATEVAAIAASFGRLAELDDPIPSVFQHGDPGIWNLLVRPDGGTAFLDWEAAERVGMPLWDLLYLFRSYAIAASRRAGVRDRFTGATRHLLDGSPQGERLVAAIDAYRRRISLPVGAIIPLTLACWIHRSLKEATRLPPDRLQRGQFVRLVRRMLHEPEAPILARLAGLGDDPSAGAT